MVGKTIGYARTATHDEDISAQVEALRRAGCNPIFIDPGACGATLNRFGLRQVLNTLESGDTIKVQDIDRIARTGEAFSEFRERLGEREIRIIILDGDIETTPALAEAAMRL